MKNSDIVILALMLCFLAGGVFAYITASWAIGFGAIVVFACFFIFCSALKQKSNRYVSREVFITTLLIDGKEKSNVYIKCLYPQAEFRDEKFICDDTLICNLFKFSALNEEDVASCFRYAKKHNLKKVIIFTNNADKKALNLSYRLDMSILVYNYKKFYSMLKSVGVLPDKNSETVLKKQNLKAIISGFAFIPVKYFAWSSISTAFLSIVLPLKLYYLVFAVINAVLGIIVFVLNRKITGAKKTN